MAGSGSGPKRPKAQSKRDLLGLVLAAGFLFFFGLGERDLWRPNEPIYGRAVAEMAASGDWMKPTVNGEVFSEKPILYFWAALTTSKLLGGVSELSLRVPSAIAGVASVVLTYLWVLPYGGRRRAIFTAALFATMYQVFWAARSVQMDVLVLASTLGVVVPLARLIDADARPARAWIAAGLAGGLGFIAKGPVALIVPALVVIGYAMWRRRLHSLLHPVALAGLLVAFVVATPWYVLLWLAGETTLLHELLFRQNVARFLDAWDHEQPWWYYLEYFWIDFAPWSWLVPAALLSVSASSEGRRLDRFCWIWIGVVVVFFSLSDSKRSPYILPIAPAVACLSAGVLERYIGRSTGRPARLMVGFALSALGLVLVAAGAAGLSRWSEVPSDLTPIATVLVVLVVSTGALVMVGVALARRFPSMAPAALLAGLTVSYLVTAGWALTAADRWKSVRGFALEMNQTIAANEGAVVSYGFRRWRSMYSFYADRSISNLKEGPDLVEFCRDWSAPYLLVEEPLDAEVSALCPGARLVHRGPAGRAQAFLYARPESGSPR
ncbi:MAG: glycosyltransferase family 39 protein [Acidobacteria bacterium]|nr:glycosyltransferase family 39 protein [Acidobacteriota bacterium]